ncbi:hypothetical protein VT930_11940 [Mycobacterium sherrisii]|uniref:hypothetical protein n=1 Tax=Mycobacterium sherrisii TaxID=243061 RepID=UPI002DDD5FD8|nr:hypothetical protein [Mycobacterium sherrisii]MEC4763815.1 hypothetical protein [Mycobacterium sherrisii]
MTPLCIPLPSGWTTACTEDGEFYATDRKPFLLGASSAVSAPAGAVQFLERRHLSAAPALALFTLLAGQPDAHLMHTSRAEANTLSDRTFGKSLFETQLANQRISVLV